MDAVSIAPLTSKEQAVQHQTGPSTIKHQTGPLDPWTLEVGDGEARHREVGDREVGYREVVDQEVGEVGDADPGPLKRGV